MAGLIFDRWMRSEGAALDGEPRTGGTPSPTVSPHHNHAIPRFASGRRITWAIILTVLGVCGAPAEDLSRARNGWSTPRVVFFNNYFLIAAQEEVMTMAVAERIALGKLLDICAGTLIIADVPRQRCELSRLQYLMNYRRNRNLDRLLDAVQYMETLFRYNYAIGRESEAGIDDRIGTIRAELATAVSLASDHTDDPAD
jgi:hypothetical protein